MAPRQVTAPQGPTLERVRGSEYFSRSSSDGGAPTVTLAAGQCVVMA